MHIVMLSDYETLGGAAVAASRLAEGLCAGHRVTRCVLFPDGQLHPWRTWPLSSQPVHSGWGRFAARLGLARPLTPEPAVQLRYALKKLRPDVINVHNLHCGSHLGWTPDLVAICAKFAPVVWTLHDMWSFTGRCPYSYDCRKFENGCDASCPTPGEHPILAPEAIAPAWHGRRQLFQEHPDLIAVTPSRWLAQEARRGLWRGHHVVTIPYGVPTETYRPVDRHEARRTLGISTSGPVVLLAAQDVSERRKGGALLPLLWPHVRWRPFTLLIMGEGSLAVPEDISRSSFGWVENVDRRVLIYNAADVLLHPAPVDNFPNVVLEALACGTPVVALPIGGLPEMVRPNFSGWLAQGPEPAALAQTLDQALKAVTAGRNLRNSCRERALREYSFSLQTDRYNLLFGNRVDVMSRGRAFEVTEPFVEERRQFPQGTQGTQFVMFR